MADAKKKPEEKKPEEKPEEKKPEEKPKPKTIPEWEAAGQEWAKKEAAYQAELTRLNNAVGALEVTIRTQAALIPRIG